MKNKVPAVYKPPGTFAVCLADFYLFVAYDIKRAHWCFGLAG